MKRIIFFLLFSIVLTISGCQNDLVAPPAVSVNPGVVAEGGTFTLFAKPSEKCMVKWFGPDNIESDSPVWTRTFATHGMEGEYKVIQRMVIYDDTVSSDTVRVFVKVGQQWNTFTAMAASSSSPGAVIFPVDTTAAPTSATDTAASSEPPAEELPPPAKVVFCTAEGTNKFHFNNNGKYKLTIQEMELGSLEKYTICTSGGGCAIVGTANPRCFPNGQVGDSWVINVTGQCQMMSVMIDKLTAQATVSTEDAYVNANILLWQADNGFKVKVLVEKQ